MCTHGGSNPGCRASTQIGAGTLSHILAAAAGRASIFSTSTAADRTMPSLCLATVAAARALDEDHPALEAALRDVGFDVHRADWDDATVDWSAFDAVLLRSTWNYFDDLPRFLDWCAHVAAATTLLNPLEVVRWNTDKHYLGDLAARGIPTVESHFIEPGDNPDAFPDFSEFVVKPAVGAGSRDAQRYLRAQRAAAIAHVQRLIADHRSALIQPYLREVDTRGETALLFFDGVYSHAIRKGALLRRDEGPTQSLFAPEQISPREPDPAERALAEQIIASLPFGPLTYARVDLLPSRDGPQLLELELTEPSLFLDHAPGSAQRLARVLAQRIAAD